jgi:hypothetical protein
MHKDSHRESEITLLLILLVVEISRKNYGKDRMGGLSLSPN